MLDTEANFGLTADLNALKSISEAVVEETYRAIDRIGRQLPDDPVAVLLNEQVRVPEV